MGRRRVAKRGMAGVHRLEPSLRIAIRIDRRHHDPSHGHGIQKGDAIDASEGRQVGGPGAPNEPRSVLRIVNPVDLKH